MEYKGNKKKFNLKDQRDIGLKLQERKRKYEEDLRNPEINKAVWNEKRKKWVHPFTTQKGYVQPTVREVFVDLKDENCDTADFKNATKFVSRCFQKLERGEYDIDGNCSSNKYRVMGAGPPKRAVEVRSALFDYFIDIRSTLKGRLPMCILEDKANHLYEDYRQLKIEAGEKPDELKISKKWINLWCKDHRVSLKHPNKRFSIPQADRKRRIIQFLKNAWTVRHWWLSKYKVEPCFLSADQMPLHRNESSGQKTLNFSGSDQSCFVKENNHLSRERCTVMTIVSSSNRIKTPPVEFVFKGLGKRVKVNPPKNVTVQWAEKGSYRLQHVLKYVETLPTIHVAFFPEKRVIFTLDDYSAHLPAEVEALFYKKGYFLIHFGGGITGDLQVNDTAYHRPVKAAYRNRESKLMIDLLKENPAKIPAPNRDQIMQLFEDAWNETCKQVDNEQSFKSNMITLALDGSEDHLASQKLMDLVGLEMLQFREELLKSKPVANLKELRLQMTKPEGVRYHVKCSNEPLPDEGRELFDGDGEDLDVVDLGSDEIDDISEHSDVEETNENTNEPIEKPTEDVVDNLSENLQQVPEQSDSDTLKNLELLKQINASVRNARQQCSNSLLPYLNKIEGVTCTARRKLIAESRKMDGFVKETLSELATGGESSQFERNCFELF